MNFIKTKKSQAITLDLVLAMIIFMLIISVIFFTSEIIIQKIDENQIRYDLELVSRNSFEILLNSAGNPSNWHNNSLTFNSTDIKSIGLTDGRNSLLDIKKVDFFINSFDLYYDEYLKTIGLIGFNYSLFFNITQYDINYNKLDEDVIGKVPSSKKHVLIIERLAFNTLHDRYIKIKMGVWI
jgi:hypothetical protein